ncbi:hypothetical protein [Streptomyces sp. NPDC059828]|uniref:hypothetical protein n=1 Tax=Streptomyces sp. NPDC059828 TaxID=3346965 RepID=UPI003656A46E
MSEPRCSSWEKSRVLRKTAGAWQWFDDAMTVAEHELLGGPFPNPLHASADALWAALDAEHPDAHPEQYPDPHCEESRTAKRAWGTRRSDLERALRTTGALPLCHHGCVSREWLAVNGAERGTMRCDPEGDGVHLYPDHLDGDPDSRRITFGQFYLAWLEEAARTIAGSAWCGADR